MFLTLVLCLMPASRALADALAVHGIWTSDFTTNPVTQLVSSSGKVGGTVILHLSLTGIVTNGLTLENLKVTKLTIQEENGHTDDVDVTSQVTPTAAASALCGDPNTGTNIYCDWNWQTTGYRNGLHDITATVQYSLVNFRNGQSTNYTVGPTTITLDVQNLLITATTPANPNPVLYNPANNRNTTLSATVTCCYKWSQPVVLQIYTSSQTPVKKYTSDVVIGPTTTSLSFTWDGSSDSPALYPDQVNPPMAKGVYLFEWTVGQVGIGVDLDFDKSSLLTIPVTPQSTASLVTNYTPANDTNSFTDAAVLYDAGNPIAAASQAQVTVYDSSLNVVTTVALPTATTGAGGTQQWDNTALTFIINTPGAFTHLFAAQDNHSNNDRGHRQKWALQNAQLPIHPVIDDIDDYAAVINIFDNPILTDIDTQAKQWQKQVFLSNGPPVNYGAYDARADGEADNGFIMGTLPTDRVMHFAGHGVYWNNNMQQFGGAVMTTGNAPNLYIYANNPHAPAQSLSSLDLHKVKLVVWESCYSADVDNSGQNLGCIMSQTVTSGATCAIGFHGEITIWVAAPPAGQDANIAKVWSHYFWQAMAQGEGGVAGPPDAASGAADFAKRTIDNLYPGNAYNYRGCAEAGADVKIVPIQQG